MPSSWALNGPRTLPSYGIFHNWLFETGTAIVDAVIDR